MSILCSQGHTNPDGATFCDECGEPLPAEASANVPDQDEEAPTMPAGGAPAAPADADAPADFDLPQPVPAADFEATQAAPDAPVIPPPADDAETVTAVPSAPPEPAPFPPPPSAQPEPEPVAFAPSAPPEPTPVAFAPSAPPEPVSFAPPPSAPEFAPMAAPVAPPPTPVAAQPRLTVEGTTTTFDLAGKATVVVGREDAPSNSFPDIDLTAYGAEEGGVSRLHARLILSGNDWTIEDLESTNFTFVNRKRIAPKTPTPLNDGDEIRLGRVGLRFKTLA